MLSNLHGSAFSADVTKWKAFKFFDSSELELENAEGSLNLFNVSCCRSWSRFGQTDYTSKAK